MNEPDVVLTDYALALECIVFVWWLHRRGGKNSLLKKWMHLFFGSLAAASLAGGTVHGFFPDRHSPGGLLLWKATLLAIGVTALAAWNLGGGLLFSSRGARWMARAAALQFLLYAGVVLFLNHQFGVAILDYLPPTLFLLVAFMVTARRGRSPAASLGTAGLALTLLAAASQQMRITLHPAYFDHNALYHTIQAVALVFIFVGFRGLLATPEGSNADKA